MVDSIEDAMGSRSHFVFVGKLGFSLAYLEVDMEDGAILPLGILDTDPDLRNSGSLDAAVNGPYHSDGDPTPDIPACPGVGFPPFGGEADGEAL